MFVFHWTLRKWKNEESISDWVRKGLIKVICKKQPVSCISWHDKKGQSLHKDFINLAGLSVSPKMKSFHLPHSFLKYGQILCYLKVTVPKWYSKVEIKLIFNPQNLNLGSVLLTTYLYCWKISKWLKQQVRPARYIIAMKVLLSQGKKQL